jgi:hypothetical protein
MLVWGLANLAVSAGLEQGDSGSDFSRARRSTGDAGCGVHSASRAGQHGPTAAAISASFIEASATTARDWAVGIGATGLATIQTAIFSVFGSVFEHPTTLPATHAVVFPSATSLKSRIIFFRSNCLRAKKFSL